MMNATGSFTITYTEKDGLLYPDLGLPEQSGEGIGRFGCIRRTKLNSAAAQTEQCRRRN